LQETCGELNYERTVIELRNGVSPNFNEIILNR